MLQQKMFSKINSFINKKTVNQKKTFSAKGKTIKDITNKIQENQNKPFQEIRSKKYSVNMDMMGKEHQSKKSTHLMRKNK